MMFILKFDVQKASTGVAKRVISGLVNFVTSSASTCLQHQRPYIKDVCTEGGRGVCPKADIVREVAWIYSYRSSQNADKGGRGSKILKILRTYLMDSPLHAKIIELHVIFVTS